MTENIHVIISFFPPFKTEEGEWEQFKSTVAWDADDEDEGKEESNEPVAGPSQPTLQPTAQQRRNLRGKTLAALNMMKNACIDLQNSIGVLEAVVRDTPLADLAQAVAQVMPFVSSFKQPEPAAGLEAEPPSKRRKKSAGSETELSTDEQSLKPRHNKKTKDWTCPLCDFTSASRNSVDSHMRKEHGGKVLVCTLCNWSTTNRDSLNRHMRQKHGQE